MARLLMTPRSSASRSSRRTRSISLRSQTTTPPVSTSSRLEILPLELRHMIYSHLLTDHEEQKLNHPLTSVSKQTRADFAKTLARLLGPKAMLAVEMSNNPVYFSLSYDVTLGGVEGVQDILTRRFSLPGRSFHTGWNVFRKSEIVRQILRQTMYVVVNWPFLDTMIWIDFKRGAKPDVSFYSACRLDRDARTRVTSREAEKMLLETVEAWKLDGKGHSADWTDAYIKELKKKWQGLRKEAREFAKLRAFEEAKRRRAARESAR